MGQAIGRLQAKVLMLPFAALDSPAASARLRCGSGCLIPWFAKEPKLKHPRNNARGEELEEKGQVQGP